MSNGWQSIDQAALPPISPPSNLILPNTSERDTVDPRVQVELERLNTATDDINKLEVDLDEARATFKELLCESTYKIDALAKKLSSHIEKSRPYYDARFQAKETLFAAQKAAIKFEKANSQHAAAKEMVYLAEEGLKTEGRCFDHAWQEMLNHATSRVNESEHERAVCEVEHKKTTLLYHEAEHNVQILQKELKRAISKSRPFYEMKAHFNQTLEDQKLRVTALEKSVSDAKMTYAEALRNLEKISEEIHKTRQHDESIYIKKFEGEKCISVLPKTNSSDSTTTESPDSTDNTSDEYSNVFEKLHQIASYSLPDVTISLLVEKDISPEYPTNCPVNISLTQPRKYIKSDRPWNTNAHSQHITQDPTAAKTNLTAALPDVMGILSPLEKKSEIKLCTEENVSTCNTEEWTEIKLIHSPEEKANIVGSVNKATEFQNNILDKDSSKEMQNNSPNTNKFSRRKKLVSQNSLPAMPRENEISVSKEKKGEMIRSPSLKRKLDSCLTTWMSRNPVPGASNAENLVSSSRRQSLDVLWNSNTGERVKEFLNQGMMMLSISNLTERRFSEQRIPGSMQNDQKVEEVEKIDLKEKKIPSPLERTLNYLNINDDTDNDSLASNEMLTEDQISSLMMEPDINQVCQEILGTPLQEVCPLFQQIQQQ
ncbi:uncharacterized protein LOC106649804 isoform X1 [Trichogramma pretiosum]|uniref:uncharacterized protein LOC106649804 isoform X1 n=1 Tax=Trichogramma pretiosum TaxID=7493 RepID=UPI000C71C17A|nr:uncharacterized protein LOC106649804 isoform X1 [Trichogramma pretiosum]